MRAFSAVILIMVTSVTLFAQSGYVQEGKASFYADKFEGRTTASGERYSHAKSTCAHLSLPFGTLVKVTQISSGESVVVRVNDRGPFVPNRIIDLSRSAAEKLGFISEGVTDVRIEVLDNEGNVLPQTPPSKPKENPETKNPRPTTQPQPQHFDKPNVAPQPQPQPQP
ncbi:MAG TPA: septal ring lytic transglycosylase RlpA family protein, partial [Tenuifilaceae bacterium]|nr:septal ring lytic transglycosylase RlpA family protein [Tenuifilaceae bacterium]